MEILDVGIILIIHPTKHTLSVHFLITLVTSFITKSIHLVAGVLSLSICFLTIASNAMSGVKRPTLNNNIKRNSN